MVGKYRKLISNVLEKQHRIFLERLRSFSVKRNGNVAMMFALSALALFGMVGLATDYSRAITVKERLAYAIDLAALAAGSSTQLSIEERGELVDAYMDANYKSNSIGDIQDISVNDNDDTISIDAVSRVETTFMKIVGIDFIDVSASTEVTRKSTGLEVAMVLDNTGSMSGSKIAALKSSAHNLVDILFGSDSSPPLLRVALVPFAASVNIGTGAIGEGWMDMASTADIAQSKFNFQAGETVWDLFNRIPNRQWEGCVETRKPPYDTTDDAPTSANTKWQPYFAPDEPSSGYDNNYLNDGTSGTDLQRVKYTGKYNGTSVSSSSKGPHFGCTVDTLTPLTNSRSTIEDAIDTMGADGYTHIPVGIAWGWRVLSPDEPFTEGKPYDDNDWKKAMVILTDGENTIDSQSTSLKSNYSAYGHLIHGRLGTTNASTFVNKLNANTALLCQRVKAKGIRVYSITFNVNTNTVRDLMRNCATDPSLYFDTPSAAELDTAFEAIASDLNNLRISK
jgi:Flp pilus assembly protein TadG